MRLPSLAGIEGAGLIEPEMHEDERGFFAVLNLPVPAGPHRWCVARSAQACTLRGLHVRPLPGEAKLVRCSAGTAYDVMADLRPGSATYGDWAAVFLNAGSPETLVIPAGCAHGYLTLTDNTELTYRIDADYAPGTDIVIAWNDPELAIRWPRQPLVMSGRDAKAPPLAGVVALLDA